MCAPHRPTASPHRHFTRVGRFSRWDRGRTGHPNPPLSNAAPDKLGCRDTRDLWRHLMSWQVGRPASSPRAVSCRMMLAISVRHVRLLSSRLDSSNCVEPQIGEVGTTWKQSFFPHRGIPSGASCRGAFQLATGRAASSKRWRDAFPTSD